MQPGCAGQLFHISINNLATMITAMTRFAGVICDFSENISFIESNIPAMALMPTNMSTIKQFCLLVKLKKTERFPNSVLKEPAAFLC